MVILVIIFGLIVGSFLNAIIYRLHEGKSFLKGHSFCPNCHHELGPKELIPIVSFLIQKGQCRFCQKKISWQYPLVELGTAIIFVALYLKLGLSLALFIYSVYAIFLMVIFVYDLRYYLILDKVALPAIVISFFGSWLLNFRLTDLFIGGIIGLGFFLIQFVLSRGKWIGGGDLRLGLMAGFMVGWPNILLLLFLTYLIGAVVAILLLILKRKRWKDVIPLGIFISFTTLIVILFGDKIIHWYLAYLS